VENLELQSFSKAESITFNSFSTLEIADNQSTFENGTVVNFRIPSRDVNPPAAVDLKLEFTLP
jgi:hypothetical protein